MELHQVLKPIRSEMEQVEVLLRDAARAEFGPLALVIESLIESGGKRIRPALVLLAGRFYPQHDAHLLRVATAVELLHMATLIHDDLIDRAEMRRGAPTLNSHWDSKSTVLAGDYIWAKAAKIAAEVGNTQVLEIFADTVMTIVEGEIRQDYLGEPKPSRDEYYHRIYAKTAALFEGAMRAAAVLGHAPTPQVQALGQFGRKLGLAFQIVDDVLDFIGNPHEVGKPLGSDLRQGILTLPAILYYEKHPGHKILESVASKNGHSATELDAVVDEIRRSPELAAAYAEAREWAAQAQRELGVLPQNAYRQALHDLAEYVVERKK